MAGRPRLVRPMGVLLTPGAGASSDHPSLVALDVRLSEHGLPVRRVDFPYRLAGRRAPDRAPVLIEAVREAAAAFADELGVGPETLALGGRSMGGRMCSLAVAEGLPAAALVLVSYPLHPPGRPEQLRTAHFPLITVPCLFVSGDRDTFGSPEELRSATRQIKGPVRHVWIDGGDHSLRRRDDAVASAVDQWLQTTRWPPR